MGNKCIECKCNNNDTTDLSKETNFTNKKENIKNDIDKTQEDLLLNSNTKSDRKPSFAEKFSNFKKEKEKSKKSILEIKEETKEENLESKRSKQKNPISQLKFIDEMSQLTLIPQSKKTKEDIKTIKNALSKHFFIQCLSDKNKEDIINEIHLAKIGSNKLVCLQGREGKFFYILKNGIVELIIDDKSIKKLTNGESFGEFALLHNAPRSGTIRTIIQSEFWILDRNAFRHIVDTSMKENYNENKSFINSVSIFRIMDFYQQSLLCNSLYKEIFLENEIITREGDDANCIYIIKEGEVNCVKNGVVIRTLKEGENFGERSIFVNAKRSLDVIAKSNCICYSISFETLQNILGYNYKDELLKQFIKFSFHTSKILNFILPEFINKTYKTFCMKVFKKNEVVVEKGFYLSEKVIVVIDGNVVKENNESEIIGKRGEILCENNLFEKGNYETTENYIANPDCLICECETEKFLEILKVNNFSELKELSRQLVVLKNSNFLKRLPHEKIEELVEKMSVQKFKENESITKQKEKGELIYFILSGNVCFENKKKGEDDDNSIIENIDLKESECIGKNLLFEERYSETTFAKTECELLKIDKNLFRITLGPTLTSYLKDTLTIIDKTIELKDLEILFDLAVDNIRAVSLVLSKTNGKLYIIKSYPKNRIIKEKLFTLVESIKNIMLKIDHPLIVKFIKILKDRNHIFFLYEFISGIEFNVLIREIEHPTFSTYQLQFYFASILVIINFLHKNKIVHRDIRPQNFIIKENGYLSLYNLRYSKILKDKTNSIIGNYYYMAPEVIMGEGYSFEVDYWSAGVIMYECIIGHLPFVGDKEDPMSIYFAIINGNLNFPQNFEEKNFEFLISSMLTKVPSKRLAKIELIQTQKFFNGFNFSDVEYLRCTPQYLPDVEDMKGWSSNGSYKKHLFQLYNQWIHDNPNMALNDSQRASSENWFENF
jgi:cGMP-dependent protein kinase